MFKVDLLFHQNDLFAFFTKDFATYFIANEIIIEILKTLKQLFEYAVF